MGALIPDDKLIAVLIRAVSESKDAQAVFAAEAMKHLDGASDLLCGRGPIDAAMSAEARSVAAEVADALSDAEAEIAALQTALAIERETTGNLQRRVEEAEALARAAGRDAETMSRVQRETFEKLEAANGKIFELGEALKGASVAERHAASILREPDAKIAALTAERDAALVDPVHLATGGDTQIPADDEHPTPDDGLVKPQPYNPTPEVRKGVACEASAATSARIEPVAAAVSASGGGRGGEGKPVEHVASPPTSIRMVIDEDEGEVEGPNGKSAVLPKGVCQALHELRHGAPVHVTRIVREAGITPAKFRDMLPRYAKTLNSIGLRIQFNGGTLILHDITNGAKA
jgi:hypothetical protein